MPPWGSQRRPYCGFRRTACRCYAGRVSPFRCGFLGVGVELLCPRELKNEVRAGVPPTPPVAIPLAYGLYPPAFFRRVAAARCMFSMQSRRCPRVVPDMPIAVGDSYPGTIRGCLGAPLFSCLPCGKNARPFRPYAAGVASRVAGRACRPMVRPRFVAGVASFVFRITAAPLARNTEHPSQSRALPRLSAEPGRPGPL